MSKPHYDFSKFPSKYPLTVKYSAISHVRGHLHMSRLRIDNFYILTGKPPAGAPVQVGPRHTDLRPGVPLYPGHIYPWTMEDQAKLVEKALSETPFLPEKEIHADPTRQAAVSG